MDIQKIVPYIPYVLLIIGYFWGTIFLFFGGLISAEKKLTWEGRIIISGSLIITGAMILLIAAALARSLEIPRIKSNFSQEDSDFFFVFFFACAIFLFASGGSAMKEEKPAVLFLLAEGIIVLAISSLHAPSLSQLLVLLKQFSG